MCAVRSDQTLACWGENNNDQAIPPTGAFTAVACGRNRAAGVRANGTLARWGLPGDQPSGFTPPTGPFSAVTQGLYHTCALRTDGTLACWDLFENPIHVPPPGDFAAVSSGAFHTCGLQTDGGISCWGDNTYGQTSVPD